MISFGKPKEADVISHWYALVPEFGTSANEFYNAVEAELKASEVPNLDISRVDFAQGGILSGKREYLRMTREQLVFDVCAAPFGKSYFFSCRLAEIIPPIELWHIFVILFALQFILGMLWKIMGFSMGTLTMLALMAYAVWAMRNPLKVGLRDLDGTLLRMPAVGPIYFRFFRKDTYYRKDTRLMYCEMVDLVVKTKVEQVTGLMGIKMLRYNEHSPILKELYKTKEKQLA